MDTIDDLIEVEVKILRQKYGNEYRSEFWEQLGRDIDLMNGGIGDQLEAKQNYTKVKASIIYAESLIKTRRGL